MNIDPLRVIVLRDRFLLLLPGADNSELVLSIVKEAFQVQLMLINLHYYNDPTHFMIGRGACFRYQLRFCI